MPACRRLLATAAAVLALSACGGGTPTPDTTPTAAVTPTVAPSPSASPTPQPTPTPAVLSQADAQAVIAKLVFSDSGYWYECDLPPQALASCPITSRLAQRLPVLVHLIAPQGVGGGPILLRQQFFSAPATLLGITGPSPAGAYVATISLNIGSAAEPHLIRYDITLVDQSGWLVDDVACAGKPATSAYQTPGANWTCE